MKIAYTKPSITQLEVDYAADAAANGWGSKCYDYIFRFEDEFSRHIGTNYAVATSSCTGAMTMGLSALGVGKGDEVILADTNWIATAAPISHLGATPVFVDILCDTWCIDPVKVDEAINERTKAIVATHLYGNLCDMDALLDIGNRYNIPIIEDAAEAIGSTYRGKRAGSMGKFSAFSFHGTKTITTGEGGIFLTNDKILYDQVLTLSNHGRSKSQKKQFWADTLGFKFKMSNIQAALGCAQLQRIDELIARKREIFDNYKLLGNEISGVTFNDEKQCTRIGAWMPTVIFDRSLNVSREKIQKAFLNEEIDARVFFWPLSSLGMYSKRYDNFNAYDIPNRAINLPSFHDMKMNDQRKIMTIIKQLI